MRLALIALEPARLLGPGRSPFAVVGCVWRAPDATLDEIERVTGKPIGSDFPYAAEGWEAELDAMGWIDDVLADIKGAWSFSHANSESLRNLLGPYRVGQIERLGDWPKLEFINNEQRILKAVLARSPLGGTERPNKHSFEEFVTPSIAPSWRSAVSGFLDFIDFEPVWREEAKALLAAIPAEYDVHLHAFDKKHLFYAMHQGLVHPDAGFSFFSITVSCQNSLLTRMLGFYEWDGTSCPEDARAAIEKSYGNLVWASLSLINSVDDLLRGDLDEKARQSR